MLGGFGLDTILIILLLIFSLSVHEFAHAWVAYLRGDDTPALAGRLTLNPIAHIDWGGLLVLILTRKIGWMKPVPVNFWRLSSPRRLSIILVAVAGPLSNIILAFGFVLLGKLFVTLRNPWLANLFIQTAVINVFLAGFNLFFLPPLDGYRIFASLAFENPEVLFANSQVELFGTLVLLGLVFLAPTIIWKWVDFISEPIITFLNMIL